MRRREVGLYLTEDGKKIFVIDGHVHFWDARPQNRLNRCSVLLMRAGIIAITMTMTTSATGRRRMT